jgi:hypothetical protein
LHDIVANSCGFVQFVSWQFAIFNSQFSIISPVRRGLITIGFEIQGISPIPPRVYRGLLRPASLAKLGQPRVSCYPAQPGQAWPDRNGTRRNAGAALLNVYHCSKNLPLFAVCRAGRGCSRRNASRACERQEKGRTKGQGRCQRNLKKRWP